MENRFIILFFLCLSVTVFAKVNNKTLLEHIQTTDQLLLHAPEAILFNEGDRFYIEKEL